MKAIPQIAAGGECLATAVDKPHALGVGYGRVVSLIEAKLLQAGVTIMVVKNTRERADALRDQAFNVVLDNAAC